MASPQPQACIGLIGGSGLLMSTHPVLTSLKTLEVTTTLGRVLLHEGYIPAESDKLPTRLLFVQRHAAAPNHAYVQPADINYAAIALALQAQGAQVVFGITSVGSLQKTLKVGSFVCPDDYYCPYDVRRVYSDARAHTMPELDEPLREVCQQALASAGIAVVDGGVYVNTKGPRFETKAEIRSLATVGDVVGMTGAHEAAACREVRVPYAMLCVVDNFARGVGPDFSLEDFHAVQAANMEAVERSLIALLPALAAHAQSLRPAAAVTGRLPTEGREAADLLVRARWVLTMAEGCLPLDDGAVVVKDGKIVAVLKGDEALARYDAAEVVSLPHHCVMPGLVNAHTHLAMNLLRGYSDDKALMAWLTEDIWPVEGRLVSHEFVKAGVLAAALECIRGGVTCVNDMYFFPGATAEALDEAGLRGRVGGPVLEFPSAWASAADEYLAKTRELITTWRSEKPDSLVEFSVSPHAPYTVSDDTFGKVAALSKELNVPVHVHLHETPGETHASSTGSAGPGKHLSAEKCRPFDNLDRLGLVNQQLIAVHMVDTSDEEIARCAQAGTSVVHCPSSNMKLASGFCPVAKLIASGVNVALGTDGAASNNKLDMWAEMRLAALLAKGVANDPEVVPAMTALHMATLGGAKAAGLADRCGSLEVGKDADLIAISLGEPEQYPAYHVASVLAYSMDRNAVSDVWVAGSRLMASREVLSLCVSSVELSVKEWASKITPEEICATPEPEVAFGCQDTDASDFAVEGHSSAV